MNVYVITEFLKLGDEEAQDIRAITTTLDGVRKWISNYYDLRIETSHEYCNEETYLQERKRYTETKEYLLEKLKRYTEDTFGVGTEIFARDFCIGCYEVIE